MKTRRVKAWRWAAIGLLLVLSASTVAVAFILGTEPGRRWLAKKVSQALSTEEQAVRLEGLHLAWPVNVAIDRGTVADPNGVWLDIRAVACQWTPLALRDGRIAVRTLRIDSLDLARLPAGEGAEPTETAPLRLPEFVAEAVTFGRVRLAAEVCGFPVELSELRGRVEGGAGSNGAVRIKIEAKAVRVKLADVAEEQVAAEIKLRFASEDWELSGSLVGKGFRASGDLGFPGYRPWPTGDFRAEVDGASGLADDLWPGLSVGRCAFSLACPPQPDGIELAQANLSVEALRFGEQAVETATVAARLRRSNSQPDFAVEADAHLENFSFRDVAVTDAEFHVAGPWGALAVSGKVAGAFQEPFALAAAGRLQWEGDERELELKQASVRWADAQAQLTEPLRIRLQGDQSSLSGAAKMEPFDLSSISNAAFGMLDGRIAGEMHLGGTLSEPEIEGDVSCAELVARTDAGTASPPVDGSGRFSVSGGVLRLSANVETATNGSARLEAQVPVQVSLVPWELGLNRDRDLSIDLDADLDLALLRGVDMFAGYEALEGKLDANLRVRGTLASPEVAGTVRGEWLAARTDVWEQVPTVAGAGQVGYSNGIWRAALEAGTATNGTLRLKALVPAPLSLVPWKLALDRDRDLSVELDAGLDLASLNGLDDFANGRIGGRIELSVAHVGSMASGAVTGACTLAGGEYENYSLGTVIREAQLRLVSRGKALIVESGSATDGGKGQLTLSGSLRPDVSTGLPYKLEIDCRQMRLLRRPDAEATVSGKLALDGTVSRLCATGDWQIDNAVVDLRNLRPPPPDELEPAQVVESATAIRMPDRAFTLRLAVSIPGSLYVRGGMLDTAWAGNLVLAHERGETDLSGYLEPRRGTVLLLKRPFKLDEGRIDFDGRWPPEPLLRLTAVYVRADLSARAQITGPARDPDVVLTSTPALPEDEILAQILFGENMSSLTPLQAISLASEAAKLRNIAGGGGVLDGVQAAMGIDRVEFRETGQDAAAPEVAVGKYVGDRSYVEMRRAATMDSSQGTRLFLEHELRPNVVLEAESGLEMRSGAGLFWKRDY